MLLDFSKTGTTNNVVIRELMRKTTEGVRWSPVVAGRRDHDTISILDVCDSLREAVSSGKKISRMLHKKLYVSAEYLGLPETAGLSLR